VLDSDTVKVSVEKLIGRQDRMGNFSMGGEELDLNETWVEQGVEDNARISWQEENEPISRLAVDTEGIYRGGTIVDPQLVAKMGLMGELNMQFTVVIRNDCQVGLMVKGAKEQVTLAELMDLLGVHYWLTDYAHPEKKVAEIKVQFGGGSCKAIKASDWAKELQQKIDTLRANSAEGQPLKVQGKVYMPPLKKRIGKYFGQFDRQNPPGMTW